MVEWRRRRRPRFRAAQQRHRPQIPGRNAARRPRRHRLRQRRMARFVLHQWRVTSSTGQDRSRVLESPLQKQSRRNLHAMSPQKAGLQGQGYSMGVAVGDYNNDGHEDLFVVGVHANFLYRNNGDGTFTDVTARRGAGRSGRRRASRCGRWPPAGSTTTTTAGSICSFPTTATGSPAPIRSAEACRQQARAYCHPDRYRAESMQLYHNNGDGTFSEVTHAAGLARCARQGYGPGRSGFCRRRPPRHLYRQ